MGKVSTKHNKLGWTLSIYLKKKKKRRTYYCTTLQVRVTGYCRYVKALK